MNRTVVGFGIACMAVLAACSNNGSGDGVVDVNGDNGHTCSMVRVSGDWTAKHLYLHHQDSRSCPAMGTVAPYDWVESGGIITQTTAGFNLCSPVTFDPPSCGIAVTAFLRVYPTTAACTESAFTNPTADTEESFHQANWLQDGNPTTWGAGIWQTYQAGTGSDPNYDCPGFTVEISDNPSAPFFPEAITKVKYNEADMVPRIP